jgi:hypothetical protein
MQTKLKLIDKKTKEIQVNRRPGALWGVARVMITSIFSIYDLNSGNANKDLMITPPFEI